MDMYSMSQSRKEIEGRVYTFTWPQNAPIKEVYEFLSENINTFVQLAQAYEQRKNEETTKTEEKPTEQ